VSASEAPPRPPPRPLDPDLRRELYVAHRKVVEAFVDGMVLLLLAERGRLDARQDAEDMLRTLKDLGRGAAESRAVTVLAIWPTRAPPSGGVFVLR
jgi:hypothetical protein